MKVDESWVVLQHTAMRIVLSPKQGGGIRELAWQGQPLLRPTPADAGDDPFDLACFPMVPYANRIAHGAFHFGRHDVRVKPQWSGTPHPLHGQGWRRAWSVVSTSTSSAKLGFDGGGDEWPWRYRCEQSFELTADEVAIELSIKNLSDEPMPAVLGLHPYFPAATQARLEASLPRVWLTDETALPLDETRTPEAWRFEPGRAVRDVPLDHCFSGWNGAAVLRWPHRSIRMSAPDCCFLHVYVPAAQDFFCIEPQSAAAGALGREGEARTLGPGERFAIHVHWAAGTS
jgi:aldose 1-epimerase